MATREQILNALLAVLTTTGSFALVSRRDRAPEQIGPGQSPALFLIDKGEHYERKSLNLPPIRTLRVEAIFYNDVGADLNLIPTTIVNNALDALDAAMAPDNPRTGLFTLGGLCYSCLISGEMPKVSGAKTGKGGAIVPIEIELP
jgi:hypothetical protein